MSPPPEPPPSAPRPEGAPPGVVIAVTDHAAERFAQRVAGRRGDLDPRAEITARVSRAWAQGRIGDRPPGAAADVPAKRGTVYVADLVDRDVVFVCRHDARGRELVVITLWESERLGPARVPREFTDALEPRRR